VSEKVAAGSLSEINSVRDQVKQRIAEQQLARESEQDEDGPDEMAPGRPA
jgi:hypothetical protein